MKTVRILALTTVLFLAVLSSVSHVGPQLGQEPRPLPVSLWANACGDGHVDTILDDFDSPWTVCCTAGPSIPTPTPRIVPGCHGNAMAVDYNLTDIAFPDGPDKPGQSWIVLQRSLPPDKRDLMGFTHIRLAWKGSNLNSHDSIDVKLNDGNAVYTVRLDSMTDMLGWRAIYVDLRQFGGAGTINLKTIVGLEIGITRCRVPATAASADPQPCEVFDNPSAGGPPEQHVGTLSLDEFAAVNLNPGAVNRLRETGFETVTARPTIRADAAHALLAQVTTSGPGTDLIPAWFPEPTPNFNSYVQAEALLVFVYEYERTGTAAFRAAAQRLTAKLLSLQIPPGRAQAGAWYSAYTAQRGALSPPYRAIPTDQPPPCDGDEAMVDDPASGQLVGVEHRRLRMGRERRLVADCSGPGAA